MKRLSSYAYLLGLLMTVIFLMASCVGSYESRSGYGCKATKKQGDSGKVWKMKH